MSVEVTPLDMACNLGCEYCYQSNLRQAGNTVAGKYDMDAMLQALEAEGQRFTVFGGEPLLVPLPDLERLWAFGLERYGGNGIQTAGNLATEEHLAAFERYQVNVGISMDGPGELNDVRSAGTLEQTRAATERSHQLLLRLCREGKRPSLIVTLHRGNATPERLPRLVEWLRDLDRAGLRWCTVHLLEVESPEVAEQWRLPTEHEVAALRRLAQLEHELQLRFDLFTNMRNLLLGLDRLADRDGEEWVCTACEHRWPLAVREDGRMDWPSNCPECNHRAPSCVWGACDPWTTTAVRGVSSQGQRSNCQRTNKAGINMLKAESYGFERQGALHRTPQADGGCQGCRFFAMCKGQCPGTAINGDWRNRSEHCEVYLELFAQLEADLVAAGEEPVSLRGDLADIEATMLAAWAGGHNVTIYAAMRHLDGTEPLQLGAADAHADVPHGDSDVHQDHLDEVHTHTDTQHADHQDGAVHFHVMGVVEVEQGGEDAST